MIKNWLLSVGLAATCVSSAFAGATPDSVTQGPAYANQVWYKLGTGVTGTSLQSNWHIGFDYGGPEGMGGSVIINGGLGLKLYVVPNIGIDAWDTIKTLDPSWPEQLNNDTNWAEGAFNRTKELNNDFDFGWGEYNMNSHVIEGTKVFIIVTPKMGEVPSMSFKFRIDGLSGGKYMFTYAFLDGSNEMTGIATKADFGGRLFGYYDLTKNMLVEHGPAKTEWDWTILKYTMNYALRDSVGNITGYMPYPVTGILSNPNAMVAQITTETPNSEPIPDSSTFVTDANVIGDDWKSFGGTGYTVKSNVAYFVLNRDGDIYRMVFTKFAGSSTGVSAFNTEKLEVATTVNEDGTKLTMGVYPNVVDNGGMVSVVVAGEAQTLQIYNTLGNLVRTVNASSIGNFADVQIGGLPSGMYHAVINTGSRTVSAPFVVR